MLCCVADCVREATSGAYCYLHRKRLQRGMPLHSPVHARGRGLWERLSEAALEYADAETEEDAATAEVHLRAAARNYGNGQE